MAATNLRYLKPVETERCLLLEEGVLSDVQPTSWVETMVLIAD